MLGTPYSTLSWIQSQTAASRAAPRGVSPNSSQARSANVSDSQSRLGSSQWRSSGGRSSTRCWTSRSSGIASGSGEMRTVAEYENERRVGGQIEAPADVAVEVAEAHRRRLGRPVLLDDRVLDGGMRLDEHDGVSVRFGVVLEFTAHAKVHRVLRINQKSPGPWRSRGSIACCAPERRDGARVTRNAPEGNRAVAHCGRASSTRLPSGSRT